MLSDEQREIFKNLIGIIKQDQSKAILSSLHTNLKGLLEYFRVGLAKGGGPIRRRLLLTAIEKTEKLLLQSDQPDPEMLDEVNEILTYLSPLMACTISFGRRGRRASRRTLSVAAYEMHETNKLSWEQIARKLKTNRETLRQGVMDLKRRMKTWGCI